MGMGKPKGKKKKEEIKEKQLDEEDENIYVDAHVKILNKKVDQLRDDVQMKLDLEEERKSKFVIASDLTRQYKAMLVDKESTINDYNLKIEEIEKKLLALKSRYKETQETKDKELSDQKDKAKVLEQHISDMSRQFAKILEETLETMQKKVQSANE